MTKAGLLNKTNPTWRMTAIFPSPSKNMTVFTHQALHTYRVETVNKKPPLAGSFSSS